jgi:hypothetical protein
MPVGQVCSSRCLRLLACVAGLAIATASGRPARAAEGGDLAPFLSHLEFLGYTCRIEEGEILARHPTHANLMLKPLAGGFFVRSGYRRKDDKELPREALAIANELNAQAAAARFLWAKEGALVAEAWYPGSYDKQRFATFLEVWDSDLARLGRFKERLAPFLT